MFDCAAVGFADVTSANVVGYSQIAIRKGSIMRGASFNTITSDGMKLSQLIPGGYEKNSSYTDKKKGTGSIDDITITILDKNGATDVDANGNMKLYYWRHKWSSKSGWEAAGAWWQYDVATTKYVQITADNDVTFGAGEALWIASQKYENDIIIMNNGEALMDSRALDIRKGSKGLSAPLSATCKLSQITPKGYEKNSSYTDKKKGTGSIDDITITVLDKNGATDVDANGNMKLYYWRHKWSSKSGWEAAGAWWQYDVATTKYVQITADNDVTFAMGEGLWVASQKYENDIVLEFPGIDDTPAAE